MTTMIGILSLFLSSRVIHASYSLSYYSNEVTTKILNAGLHSFQDTPSAHHIADIYTRISGLSPIFREENVPLPMLGVFSSKEKLPVILEVIGGSLPTFTQSLIGGKGISSSSSIPKVESVAAVLHQNKIQAETFVIHNEAGDNKQLSEWLQKQTQPVLILHHEMSSSSSNDRRMLGASNTTVLTAPLDERQISQYQICLWTGLMLVLLLLASVCGIAQMEVVPDSLLYAKFQSGRTGGKFD